MAENQTVGIPKNNQEPNTPSDGIQYQASIENIEISPSPQPSSEMIRQAASGSFPTETVSPGWPSYEPASRQAVDVGINSLRSHVDDCINAVNSKLASAEDLFKSKLENIEVKLNSQVELLKKEVQILMDERKTKKDRGWDIRILIITIIISILGGVALTLIAEKWIIPLITK